jgi:hypothetical protein
MRCGTRPSSKSCEIRFQSSFDATSLGAFLKFKGFKSTGEFATFLLLKELLVYYWQRGGHSAVSTGIAEIKVKRKK